MMSDFDDMYEDYSLFWLNIKAPYPLTKLHYFASVSATFAQSEWGRVRGDLAHFPCEGDDESGMWPQSTRDPVPF